MAPLVEWSQLSQRRSVVRAKVCEKAFLDVGPCRRHEGDGQGCSNDDMSHGGLPGVASGRVPIVAAVACGWQKKNGRAASRWRPSSQSRGAAGWMRPCGRRLCNHQHHRRTHRDFARGQRVRFFGQEAQRPREPPTRKLLSRPALEHDQAQATKAACQPPITRQISTCESPRPKRLARRPGVARRTGGCRWSIA